MTTETEWGPWIPHDGGPCPRPDAKAGEFEVEKANGSRFTTEEFSAWQLTSWERESDDEWRIVAYHLRIPAPDWKGIAMKAISSLGAYDLWAETPQDRGGNNGRKGRAFRRFIDRKNDALEAARKAGLK